MRLISIVLTFLLISCSTESTYKSNKFYNDIMLFFKKYNYKIEYERTNTEFTFLEVNINKKDIKKDDLQEIKKNLLNNGWEYNYDIKGYYWSYCKRNSNDAIRIYYPSDEVKEMRNGTYFSNQLNPDIVYIWMTNYKSDKLNKEITECN